MKTRIIIILLMVLMAPRVVKMTCDNRIPCEFPDEGDDDDIAGHNEVGYYYTTTSQSGSCSIKTHEVMKIEEDRNIKYPPVLTSYNVIEDKYMEHNIKCEDDEIAYLIMDEFDFSDGKCRNDQRCKNYLQVAGKFGIAFDECGISPQYADIIPTGTFKIIFRSVGSQLQVPNIKILCFGGKRSYRTRRKRNLPDHPIKTQCGGDGLAYRQDFTQRIKRQVGTRKIGDTLTSRQINVLYGMSVTYHNKRIDFIDSNTSQIISNMSIFNIETLYTYHLNGDVIDYNVSALNGHGTCLIFSGPGPMFITPNRVYFQLFITNTTGLVPNATELEILKILKSDVLLDDVVLAAIANEDACNPVVRGYAESVLERIDPERLAELRDMLMIRLVGGVKPSEGNVEVLYGGIWGSVCDDFWDINDGNVVCKQLGYVRATQVTSRSAYGRGTGPIWMDDVRCKGTEKALSHCSHTRNHNCNHCEDAGVVCEVLRLVGGATSADGRVEVNVNGIWGTVCDDLWTINNTRVVCRQLGYDNGTTAPHLYYGPGTGPIHLDNVQCLGTERSLLECSHRGIGVHNCGHYEDVGVCCSNPLYRNSPLLALQQPLVPQPIATTPSPSSINTSSEETLTSIAP